MIIFLNRIYLISFMVLIITTIYLVACSNSSDSNRMGFPVELKDIFSSSFSEMPVILKTGKEESILLGGFSGLTFDSYNKDTDTYKFITNTDIGPNFSKFKKIDRSFDNLQYPEFIPKVILFSLNNSTKSINVNKVIPFKSLNSKFDKGYDFEGIVKANDNSYWFVDESIPSILNTDSNLNIIKRYIPENSTISNPQTDRAILPAKYNYIKHNKGFEAIAYDKHNNKIYAFLQSPLKLKLIDFNTDEYKYTWILELDLNSEKVTAEYLFAFEKKFKFSGATFFKNDEFLVLLKWKKKHYILRLTTSEATNIINKFNIIANKKLLTLKDPNLLNKFKPVYSRVFLDLQKLGFGKNDKFEGICFIEPSKIALINDNDFGLYESDNEEYKLSNTENYSFLTIIDFVTPK